MREVIFPVVGEHTFEALVREARALGTPQSRRVHTAVRASYGSYYRRMMPQAAGRARLPLQQRRAPAADRRPGRDPARGGRGAAVLSGPTRCRSRAWCARSGATSSSRTRPAAGSGSTGSTTRSASCRRCASGCAARRSGWSAPTATATPTRTCRPTSPSAGRAYYERARPAARRRRVHRRRCERRCARGAGAARPRAAAQPAGRGLEPARRHPIAVSPLEPQPEPPSLERAQGRARPALADDGPARHRSRRPTCASASPTPSRPRRRARRPTATSCGAGCCSACTASAPTPG